MFEFVIYSHMLNKKMGYDYYIYLEYKNYATKWYDGECLYNKLKNV